MYKHQPKPKKGISRPPTTPLRYHIIPRGDLLHALPALLLQVLRPHRAPVRMLQHAPARLAPLHPSPSRPFFPRPEARKRLPRLSLRRCARVPLHPRRSRTRSRGLHRARRAMPRYERAIGARRAVQEHRAGREMALPLGRVGRERLCVRFPSRGRAVVYAASAASAVDAVCAGGAGEAGSGGGAGEEGKGAGAGAGGGRREGRDVVWAHEGRGRG
ncbi:hypothetical protein CALCODRAFT_29346 [Calocera cornea HHB12733]|uniref:Uncharacterized protein n=1 Tax=Calocera cornea HHB12733 TaxID=1353952 RepID=A0A165E3U1_9BASI|nr:hypothetical protein CALCODRAFT_29346 [Calocera cornea HHB12733]